MRRDLLYLQDIVDAADAIGAFLADKSQEDFLASDLLQSAVLQKLSVIGEAVANLSADAKSRNPEVEWRDIVAFRNIAVHAYFSVRWPIVWTTATGDVPTLTAQVAQILALETARTKPAQGSP